MPTSVHGFLACFDVNINILSRLVALSVVALSWIGCEPYQLPLGPALESILVISRPDLHAAGVHNMLLLLSQLPHLCLVLIWWSLVPGHCLHVGLPSVPIGAMYDRVQARFSCHLQSSLKVSSWAGCTP